MFKNFARKVNHELTTEEPETIRKDEEGEMNQDRNILDQILSSTEEEQTLVVSSKNEYNVDYLTSYLSHNYKDDVEVEVYSAEDFFIKYGYVPPYLTETEEDEPDDKEEMEDEDEELSMASAPFRDRPSTNTFTCQYCGEQLMVQKKPEWAVKAKHALLHLQFDTEFSCVYCQFKCERPIPMFKHIPIAHNNKMETHLYPVFKSSIALEIFDKCVLECFPDTECLSILDQETDLTEQLPPHAMYYQLHLTGPKASLVNNKMKMPVNKLGIATRAMKRFSKVEATNGNKQVSCNDCGFAASSPLQLKDHIHFVHNDSSAIKVNCVQCELTCRNIEYLEDHCKLLHPNLEECSTKCQLCDYESKNPLLLTDHMKLVHMNETDE